MVEFSKRKLKILKSFGTNFAIVKEWGYEPSKVFMVVVESGQLKKAVEILSDTDMPKLNAFMSAKELQNVLTNHALTFAVYPYLSNRKNNEFLSMLSGIARVGEISGKSLRAFPIVVAEGVPSGIDLQDYFTVYLSGSLEAISLDENDVVPDDTQIPVVYDKLRAFLSLEQSLEERTLLAATCFLYPNIVQADNEALFDKYIAVAKDMVIQDDENKDSNNLKDIFIREMYQWQENTEFSEAYELPCLEMAVVDRIEKVILYDSDYLYLKESFFKDILERLLRIFSVDVLKRELLDAGILSSDKSKTYTVKVTYIDITGQYQRERMLRFEREKMKILGDMEFIEQCISGREC